MITGALLKSAFISGANNINNNRQAVDELNIFPVPDGDTGTNMSMTITNAAKALAVISDEEPVGSVADTAASALLRGARGNSGVILSLIFRGFSKGLKGLREADGAQVAAALQNGVDAAYKAVMKPTEGTILTVIRCAAQEAQKAAAEDRRRRWDRREREVLPRGCVPCRCAGPWQHRRRPGHYDGGGEQVAPLNPRLAGAVGVVGPIGLIGLISGD